MPKLKDEEILYRASLILKERMVREDAPYLDRPQATIEYLEATYCMREREYFGMLSLTNRNRVIKTHELFSGTIDGAAVYPREVVKQVLADNAAAVVFFHNHPSGVAEPSQADIRITERLTKALATIDVRVLDHIIVGTPGNHTSMAEKGLV